jgi:hypothetical protein
MNMLAVWLPYLILVVLILVMMWKLLGVTKTQGQIIDRLDRIATALENRKS